MNVSAIVQLLVLLMVANTAPLVAKKLLGGRFTTPLDGGLAFLDGRPLFGPSKTLRGLLSALLATAAVAPLVGVEWRIGLLIAGLAMAGDLVSSFLKRRLKRPSSSKATGLDQIPESLLPALACQGPLELSVADVGVVAAVFFVGEIVLARLSYRLHFRDQPY